MPCSPGGESASPLCECGCERVVTVGLRFVRGHNKRRWTAELIVGAIERWTVERGRPPSREEWTRGQVPSGEYPATSTVIRVFHSWDAALKEVGVPFVRRQQWTRGLIITAIQRWAHEHGRAPTSTAWRGRGVMRDEFPTPDTVKKVLGLSWHDALDEAGVIPVREQRWRNLDPAFGHWLAGLIDGEGSFGIQRSGRYLYPRFVLGLRDDNGDVVEDIQLRLGLGRIYRAQPRGNRNPACVWTVASRADVEELVEILDEYPLRAKKAAEYAIWRRAAELWSAVPEERRDSGQMIELQRELRATREYRPQTSLMVGAPEHVPPVRERTWRMLEPAFGNWLAGLVDGEGSFSIRRQSKAGYRASLAVALRDDDRAILEEIKLRLGLGCIYRNMSLRGDSNTRCTWEVASRADVEKLVEILDEYPLRVKAADYAVWHRAVELWSTVPRGDRLRGPRDWGPMVELQEQLKSVRKYRPRRLPMEFLGG